MFRRTTPVVALFFALAQAFAQPAPTRSPIERDLQRLDAAIEELSRNGDRTESRRPLAAIFDDLSRDAAELSRTERDLSPERRRELEKFEQDAAEAARAEHEFWKGAGTSRPTLPAPEVAELRGTKERLARDLDEASAGRTRAAPRQAPTAAQNAAMAAREKAAQTQEQAAGARVKRSLRNPWEEKTGAAAGLATSKPPASTPTAASTGACPQCNARSHPAGLHTAAIPPPAQSSESRGFFGSLYDHVSGAAQNAYATAVSIKQTAVFYQEKMEEATGPVVSGVLEGVVDTAAGITIGSLLWALGKLLAQLGLGALLSESGIGEAILALKLKAILTGIGLVMAGWQIIAMVKALKRWLCAAPGTAESTNSLRDFVRSATIVVLAIALAVLGIKSSSKPKVSGPHEPPPPVTDTPPPPPAEGVGGNLSKIKPPDPPPETVEPAPAQPGQGPTIKVTRDVGRHYFDDGVIGRRGAGIKMAHSREKFLQALSGEGEVVADKPVPGFDGISLVEYKLYKLDIRGNRLPELREASMFKTVVDPTRWSDGRVSALARALFGGLPHRVPTTGGASSTYMVYVTRGTVRFIGWVNRATGTLTSFGVDKIGP